MSDDKSLGWSVWRDDGGELEARVAGPFINEADDEAAYSQATEAGKNIGGPANLFIDREPWVGSARSSILRGPNARRLL